MKEWFTLKNTRIVYPDPDAKAAFFDLEFSGDQGSRIREIVTPGDATPELYGRLAQASDSKTKLTVKDIDSMLPKKNRP